MNEQVFHDQSRRKNVADLGGSPPRDLLVSSQTRIQLSHRGWQWLESPNKAILMSTQNIHSIMKENFPKISKNNLLSWAIKEFELAMVKGPPVFESLRFY